MKRASESSETPLEKQKRPLSYFEPFMNACGKSYPDVAETIGLTRQGTLYWRKTNDIRLSNMTTFAEKMGYKLIINLIPTDKDYGDPAIYKQAIYSDATEDLNDSMEFSRLWFLRAAMRRDGITIKELAKAEGLTYQAICAMFDTDDIMFSRIILYADTFHWNIHCRYIQMTDKEQIHVPRKRGVCTVEVFREF